MLMESTQAFNLYPIFDRKPVGDRLPDDMATEPGGKRRKAGRILDDGSGLTMHEGIVWLPNGKAMPRFPRPKCPSTRPR